MNTNFFNQKSILTIAAIIASGFIGWLCILALFWLFLKSIGIITDLWAMVESLSAALAAAAVFTAGFIAFRELSEISTGRYMEIIDRLFEELNAPQNIAARRWIFQNLPDDPVEGLRSLTHEGRSAMKQVLNSLDRVSFLTQAGWIEEELVMPWVNPMVIKSWDKLWPYVEFERQRRNEPDYYQSASRLAEHCIEWRAKNLPDAKLTWVENAL